MLSERSYDRLRIDDLQVQRGDNLYLTLVIEQIET